MSSAVPQSQSETRLNAVDALAAVDWVNHSLGPREDWSPPLRMMTAFVLASDVPMVLYWGRDRHILFNDGAVPSFGTRAVSQGDRAANVWGDWWSAIEPQMAMVEQSGRSISAFETPFTEPDGDRIREIYWNLSYWPVPDLDGAVVGVLCAARDVTDEVFAKRKDRLIVELDDALARADTIDSVTEVALALIAAQLGARRVGFAEVDDSAAAITIRHLWTNGAMPDIRGCYPLGTFGDVTQALASGQTVIIDDAENDPRIASPDVIARYRAINLRAGLIVPIIDRGRYVGGCFVQDAVARTWTPFEIALAEAATRRLWGALVRLRADAARRESEQRYRLIFEQAEDIIFTADRDQHITDCNAAGARAMGMPRDAIIGRSIAEFVTAEGFAQTSAMLGHKIEHGGNTRHEVEVTTPDGRTMRWENNSTLIRDLDDKPIGLLSISRDVTARRAFDARRELLIHELNHRVKNTLSLVQGLAHQSFRAGQDAEAASVDFLSRLSALAAAHDLLTREQWEGATIAELVQGATAHAAGRIDARGPRLLVSPKSAVAVVMALHELTTNAVKYGALSVPSGRIAVEWDAHPGDRFLLTWRESGGPAVVAPERRGFGVRMIERALASDLGGIVHMDFAATGVVCTIDGPVIA